MSGVSVLFLILGLVLGAGLVFWWAYLRVLELEKELATSKSDKKNLSAQVEKLEKIEKSLGEKLEDLLRKVYEQSHDRLAKNSKEQWGNLITPFRGEIEKLKETITTVYEKESRESLSLKTQIESMSSLYEKMSVNTDSLAKALKGDVKSQGDWGEMILERILESAGLSEGREYITQGRGLGLKSEEGRVQKPDVAIFLPGQRNLIIDSKVSLVAYERYFSADSEEERQVAREDLLKSISKHIDDLSRKDYTGLYQLNSPDYVLMFVPNDGILALATGWDRDLYQKAMEKGVSLVSPSFLLPSLRLVQNIWQREKQAKNSLQIAEEAGRLHDKFVAFVQDLKKVGDHLQKAEMARNEAEKKLSTGKGSVLTKVASLKELGAKAKKDLEIDREDLEADLLSSTDLEG